MHICIPEVARPNHESSQRGGAKGQVQGEENNRPHGRSCCRLRSELLAGARLLQRLALAAHYPVLWRHTVEGALQH